MLKIAFVKRNIKLFRPKGRNCIASQKKLYFHVDLIIIGRLENVPFLYLVANNNNNSENLLEKKKTKVCCIHSGNT